MTAMPFYIYRTGLEYCLLSEAECFHRKSTEAYKANIGSFPKVSGHQGATKSMSGIEQICAPICNTSGAGGSVESTVSC